jgi:RIO kinase 1
MPKSITKEKFKTYHSVFDAFTNRTLYKLITEGHFEGLIGPVSMGKEANVFQALKKDKTKVIVKIYRLENADFNKMYSYITSDPRFEGLKKNRRKVIFAWCQREYRNLLKAREHQVHVPTPYTFKNNVLVMEFIGNKEASPMLKDQLPEDKALFWKDIIKNYKKLYQKANLIHADLSHFNILNHNDKPVLIDLSGATPIADPNAEEYLERDLKTIINFFAKHHLKKSLEKIIKSIKSKS